MLNAIKRFFSPTIKDTSSVFYLADRIIELQTRVDELEKENRELHDLILETEINLKNAIDTKCKSMKIGIKSEDSNERAQKKQNPLHTTVWQTSMYDQNK